MTQCEYGTTDFTPRYVLDTDAETSRLVQEASFQNQRIYYLLELFRIFMKNAKEFNDIMTKHFEPFDIDDFKMAQDRALSDWGDFKKSMRAIRKIQGSLSNRRSSSPLGRTNPVTIGNVGDYFVGNAFAKGSFGVVSLGVDKKTDDFVAIKSIDKSILKKCQIETQMLKEIDIFKKVCHPNLIQLKDMYENSTHVIFCMEYANKGDLISHLRDHPHGLPEHAGRRLFSQVCEAVRYLHSDLLVVHRDIKPENILLDHGKIKLVDFGTAAYWQAPDGSSVVFQEICGTSLYMAPEVISVEEHVGPPVDIWSLGVVLYALLVGGLPFRANDFAELTAKITDGSYRMPAHLSVDAKSLICRMLLVDPKARLTIQQVLTSSWLTKKMEVFPHTSICKDIADRLHDQPVLQSCNNTPRKVPCPDPGNLPMPLVKVTWEGTQILGENTVSPNTSIYSKSRTDPSDMRNYKHFFQQENI